MTHFNKINRLHPQPVNNVTEKEIVEKLTSSIICPHAAIMTLKRVRPLNIIYKSLIVIPHLLTSLSKRSLLIVNKRMHEH